MVIYFIISKPGEVCDEDIDGCSTSPCLDLQNCTDVAASVHNDTTTGYICGDCPLGLVNLDNVTCTG